MEGAGWFFVGLIVGQVSIAFFVGATARRREQEAYLAGRREAIEEVGGLPDAAPASCGQAREDSVGEAREPVKTATPEKIAAAKGLASTNGNCMAKPLSGKCADCPFFEVDCRDWSPDTIAAAARAWLAEHGLSVEGTAEVKGEEQAL